MIFSSRIWILLYSHYTEIIWSIKNLKHLSINSGWQLVAENTRCSENYLGNIGSPRHAYDCANSCKEKTSNAGSLFAFGRHGTSGCINGYRWHGCYCRCYESTSKGKCNMVSDSGFDLYVFVLAKTWLPRSLTISRSKDKYDVGGGWVWAIFLTQRHENSGGGWVLILLLYEKLKWKFN